MTFLIFPNVSLAQETFFDKVTTFSCNIKYKHLGDIYTKEWITPIVPQKYQFTFDNNFISVNNKKINKFDDDDHKVTFNYTIKNQNDFDSVVKHTFFKTSKKININIYVPDYGYRGPQPYHRTKKEDAELWGDCVELKIRPTKIKSDKIDTNKTQKTIFNEILNQIKPNSSLKSDRAIILFEKVTTLSCKMKYIGGERGIEYKKEWIEAIVPPKYQITFDKNFISVNNKKINKFDDDEQKVTFKYTIKNENDLDSVVKHIFFKNTRKVNIDLYIPDYAYLGNKHYKSKRTGANLWGDCVELELKLPRNKTDNDSLSKLSETSSKVNTNKTNEKIFEEERKLKKLQEERKRLEAKIKAEKLEEENAKLKAKLEIQKAAKERAILEERIKAKKFAEEQRKKEVFIVEQKRKEAKKRKEEEARKKRILAEKKKAKEKIKKEKLARFIVSSNDFIGDLKLYVKQPNELDIFKIQKLLSDFISLKDMKWNKQKYTTFEKLYNETIKDQNFRFFHETQNQARKEKIKRENEDIVFFLKSSLNIFQKHISSNLGTKSADEAILLATKSKLLIKKYDTNKAIKLVENIKNWKKTNNIEKKNKKVALSHDTNWSELEDDLTIQQQQFCQLTDRFYNDLNTARKSKNEIKVNMVHKERQENLDALIPKGNINNWIFKVIKIDQVEDGSAAVVLGLQCRSYVGSGQTIDVKSGMSKKDKKEWRATIPYNDRRFRELAKLDQGQFIVGSGTMLEINAYKPGQKETFYASQQVGEHPLTKGLNLEGELFIANLSYIAALN